MEQLTVRTFHHRLSSFRPVCPVSHQLVVQHIKGHPLLTCHPWCARGGMCFLRALHTFFHCFLPTYIGLSLSDSLGVTKCKQLLLLPGDQGLLRSYIPRSCLYSHPPPRKQQQQQQHQQPQQQQQQRAQASASEAAFTQQSSSRENGCCFQLCRAHLSEGARAGENGVSGVLVFHRFGWLCSVSLLLYFCDSVWSHQALIEAFTYVIFIFTVPVVFLW